MKPVYLECNASTPIAMEVKGFMARALDGGFGKPWSAHCSFRSALESSASFGEQLRSIFFQRR